VGDLDLAKSANVWIGVMLFYSFLAQHYSLAADCIFSQHSEKSGVSQAEEEVLATLSG
jgi:hypothetical protein